MQQPTKAVPDRRDPRPSIAAETRAWIAVAVVLLAHAVGGVWWAATLSAELKYVRELMVEMKTQLASAYTAAEARRDFGVIESKIGDHEVRLREIERKGGPR